MKVFNFKQTISLKGFSQFLNHLADSQLETSDLKLTFIKGCLQMETREATLADLIQLYFNTEERFKLYCDGGARGNPGPGAAGFVLYKKDERLSSGGEFFKHCTNNQAEYQSLKQGVKAALQQKAVNLVIYMDSQLVVKQIKGEYKVKNPDLVDLHQAIKIDLAKLKHYEINFVPRRLNQEADRDC